MAKKKKKKKRKKTMNATKIENKNQPPRKKSKSNDDSIIITNVHKREKLLNIKSSNYLGNMELTKSKINLEKILSFSNNEIMKYNDNELNLLSYKDALIYDNRTYFQYYLSSLKTKHLLVFSFYNSNDYNSRIIKINLFLFTFAVNYTINALFFNDSTMHKIY